MADMKRLEDRATESEQELRVPSSRTLVGPTQAARIDQSSTSVRSFLVYFLESTSSATISRARARSSWRT